MSVGFSPSPIQWKLTKVNKNAAKRLKAEKKEKVQMRYIPYRTESIWSVINVWIWDLALYRFV